MLQLLHQSVSSTSSSVNQIAVPYALSASSVKFQLPVSHTPINSLPFYLFHHSDCYFPVLTSLHPRFNAIRSNCAVQSASSRTFRFHVRPSEFF